MEKEQFIEGKIPACYGSLCPVACCDDNRVEEWINEYFAFHERIKDHITSLGIKIEFVGDRVQFKNCSDGKNCKFLTNSLNKEIDPRPIDCKIYPFCIDWNSIDFNNKIIKVYYWDKGCPLVINNSIPKDFKNEVENILVRDLGFLFYGTKFKIEFIDEVLKD
ncbi:MAG: hypothetical protein PHF67_04440 [Candidatus Nanoarchaeia archaeon]|nr:hypothetical protein [Candidatus Nanoarchaeia archaeon]